MVNDPQRDRPTLDFTLRRAESSDAAAVANTYAETRRASVPAMPPPIHSENEDRAFFAGLIDGDAEVWLAETADDDPVAMAFLAIDGDWVHSLYVRPGWSGQGVGTALLDLAKVLRPGGFALWVFESNGRAHRFYQRHGMVAVRRTDGSANEERSPDIHMMWPGGDPIPALRDAIDDLDRELARLLELRSGLTAQVQAHKATDAGLPAPRDPVREAEIVARMAPYAPRLGGRRLAVIMQTVIAESLDAVDGETIRDVPQ